MLPIVVLRRLDCVLDPTKDAVLGEYHRLTAQNMPESAMERLLGCAADPKRKHPLYNSSPFTFQRLLGDPPRPLDEIEADITALEGEITGLLKGLVA